MADSGANVCITPDPSILVDIEDIPPIPLGVALHPSDTSPTHSSLCSKQGYLPITFDDGSIHHQPFLINENAMDTILSPEHLLQSSSHIATWRQTRSKLSSSMNCLTFLDHDGNTVLTLPLYTTNGLRYCSKLWAARLGYCSEWQLSTILRHCTGTPHKFYPHPLRFIAHKEQAGICKYPNIEIACT